MSMVLAKINSASKALAAPAKAGGAETMRKALENQPNSDAVKISLSSNNQVREQLRAEEKEVKEQQEETKEKSKELAQQDYTKTAVKFQNDGMSELNFKVVETESGEVVVEYPKDAGSKKWEA